MGQSKADTTYAAASAPVISILIPVFNWDVSALFRKITEEADSFGLWGRIEVIAIDDASSDRAVVQNDAAVARPGLEYSRLERNRGRSAVRNLLAAKGRGEFLLFLDCDVLPDSDRFLRDYLERAEANDCDVVCGGVSYRTRIMTDAAYDYHAYLGNRKEAKPALERNNEPWRHILTSNIMVRKSVFVGTPFDERFTGYGYEDIEWGVRLADKFRILHIDNTVSHLGLVTKQKSYEKMRDSVRNYLLLRQLCPEAFHASSVSAVAMALTGASDRLLRLLDRVLKPVFLKCPIDPLSFLFFQLNFAVLLASALRQTRRGTGTRRSGKR